MRGTRLLNKFHYNKMSFMVVLLFCIVEQTRFIGQKGDRTKGVGLT